MVVKTDDVGAAGQERFESLADAHPWPLVVQSVAGHIAWDPKRLTGISKKQLFRKIVEATLVDIEATADSTTVHAVTARVRRRVDETVQASLRSERFAKPTNEGPIHPTEALRQLKYFDEYMLNAEFDLLLSILGGPASAALLSDATGLPAAQDWNYIGNTCDCIGTLESVGIDELQVDGLLYSESARYLLSPELKLSTGVGPLQLAKYASGFVAMEELEFVAPGTRFAVAVIGARGPVGKDGDVELENARTKFLDQLSNHPDQMSRRLAKRKSEVVEGLGRATLSYLSWQDFGQLLEGELDEARARGDVTASNLIAGFLRSLATKFDRRSGQVVYSPRC